MSSYTLQNPKYHPVKKNRFKLCKKEDYDLDLKKEENK
jgi:hypothetical protein